MYTYRMHACLCMLTIIYFATFIERVSRTQFIMHATIQSVSHTFTHTYINKAMHTDIAPMYIYIYIHVNKRTIKTAIIFTLQLCHSARSKNAYLLLLQYEFLTTNTTAMISPQLIYYYDDDDYYYDCLSGKK